MQKLTLLLFLTLTPPLLAAAAETQNLAQYLNQNLPEKVLKLEVGKSTDAEIQKALGAAPEAEEDLYYYEISGVKYDLTLEIKNKKLKSLTYDLPTQSELKFENFKTWIDSAKKQEIESEARKQRGHNKGRYFYVRFPKEGIELKFQGGISKKLKQISFTETPKAQQK